VRLNEHLEHPEGELVFRHACKMGLEGIVSKRLGSRYRSGRSPQKIFSQALEPNALCRIDDIGRGQRALRGVL
jgi:hypothetical protein